MYLACACELPVQLQPLAAFALPSPPQRLPLPGHKRWYFYRDGFKGGIVAQEGRSVEWECQQLDRSQVVAFFQKWFNKEDIEEDDTYLFFRGVNRDYAECTFRYQHAGQQEFLVVAPKPNPQPDQRQAFIEAIEAEFAQDQEMEKTVLAAISPEFYQCIKQRLQQLLARRRKRERDLNREVRKEYFRKQFIGQKALSMPKYNEETGNLDDEKRVHLTV